MRSARCGIFPQPTLTRSSVERDTIEGYEDFLAAFPHDPLARRVRALLAARREALSWSRAYRADTPRCLLELYAALSARPALLGCAPAPARCCALRWSRRRISRPYDFDGLPPPPEDEYEIVDRPVIVFDEPDYAPPPMLPLFILPLQPERFRQMAAPPRHRAASCPLRRLSRRRTRSRRGVRVRSRSRISASRGASLATGQA